MLDRVEGERLKDEAVARVDTHAAPEWKDVARRCVRYVARTHAEFTTDLIWELLERHYPDVETHEPRAMGPLMMWAQRERLVEQTDRIKRSERPQHHRFPCRVWRSLLYAD